MNHGLKLALRGPEFIRDGIKALLEGQGINITAMMQNGPNTPRRSQRSSNLLNSSSKKVLR